MHREKSTYLAIEHKLQKIPAQCAHCRLHSVQECLSQKMHITRTPHLDCIQLWHLKASSVCTLWFWFAWDFWRRRAPWCISSWVLAVKISTKMVKLFIEKTEVEWPLPFSPRKTQNIISHVDTIETRTALLEVHRCGFSFEESLLSFSKTVSEARTTFKNSKKLHTKTTRHCTLTINFVHIIRFFELKSIDMSLKLQRGGSVEREVSFRHLLLKVPKSKNSKRIEKSSTTHEGEAKWLKWSYSWFGT